MSAVPAGSTGDLAGGFRRLVTAPAARDVLLAVAVLALDLTVQWNPPAAGDRWGQLAVAGYAAAGAVVLLGRRRAPLVVFGVLWLHAVVAALAVPGLRPTFVPLVALYTVASRPDAGYAAAALVAALVPAGLAVAEEVRTAPVGHAADALVVGIALFGLMNLTAFGLGRWAGTVRVRAAELERRRDEAAREAVAAERARIAHELHDIVAHAVTVMVLQASGAQRVLRADPQRAEEALGQVGRLGAQAIGELRRMLGALTATPPDLDGYAGGPADPGPGLADLPALLDELRSCGLDVRLHEEGVPGELDRSVSLTAYRVVQEALTNTARHAGTGARVLVALAWSPARLTVRVTDGPGTAAAPPAATGTGRGLLGLRERVAVVGGRFSAGTRPAGGFAVTAELPTGPTVSTMDDERVEAVRAGTHSAR